MYCVKCGKELKKGLYFCDDCGEPVKENIDKVKFPLPAIQTEKAEKKVKQPEPKRTGNARKVIIVSLLIVLAIVLIAVLVYGLAKIKWAKLFSDFLMIIAVLALGCFVISLLIWLFKVLAKKSTGKIKGWFFGSLFVLIASGVIANKFDPSEKKQVAKEETKAVEVISEATIEPSVVQEEIQAEVWDKKESTEHIVYLCSDKSAIVSKADKSGKSALYLTVQGKINKLPVVAIEDKAFQDCKNLKNINLPSSLKSIGEYAFSGCPKILKFKLPDSLEEIGDYAFEGCTSLTELRIPKNVAKLEANTFKGTKIKTLYIPDTCEIPEGNDPFGLGKKCKIEIYKTGK